MAEEIPPVNMSQEPEMKLIELLIPSTAALATIATFAYSSNLSVFPLRALEFLPNEKSAQGISPP